jgi:hypothetical protein
MPAASLAVNEARPVTRFSVTDTDTTLTVATSALQAQVDKTSGTVTFLTPSGTVILAEDSMNPHQLTPAASGAGPYRRSERSRQTRATGTTAWASTSSNRAGT